MPAKVQRFKLAWCNLLYTAFLDTQKEAFPILRESFFLYTLRWLSIHSDTYTILLDRLSESY